MGGFGTREVTDVFKEEKEAWTVWDLVGHRREVGFYSERDGSPWGFWVNE